MINILLSKIKSIKIDICSIEYEEGSITLPENLMKKAGLRPYQEVDVNSKYGKSRIRTYVLPGKQVEMNGGAANYFNPGEIVHINAYGSIDENIDYKPIII